MWLKVIVVILFLGVVFCLGRGLYFLLTGRSGSAGLIHSLTARVTLTALLMLIIASAWLFGDFHSQTPWLYK